MARDQIYLRDALVDVLLQKVWSDPDPSVTTLDSLEALLDPDELPQYAQVLLEKVRADTDPSWSMLDRLHNLAGREMQGSMARR
jgi:hypothetical protein